MKQYTVPANALTLWRVRVLILFLLAGGISVGLAFISYWFLLISAAALTAALYFSLWYFPRLVKSCKIKVYKDFISVTRGVYIKTENIMPSPRLIYAQKLTTPLSKQLGLCVLSLSAVGSRVIIGAVSISDASEIIKQLSGEGAQ